MPPSFGQVIAMSLEDQLAVIASKAQRAQELLAANDVRSAVGGTDVMAALDLIENSQDLIDPIPTGFPALDEILDGGLPPGLIILGAISSIGKTTLVEQIASKLAREGIYVVFVSLEQGVREIVSKELSRHSYLGYSTVTPSNYYTNATKRKAMNGIAQFNLTHDLEVYRDEVAPNMLIVEPDGQITARDVAQRVRSAYAIASTHNKKMVLIIDYLQLLGPSDPKMGEKQAIEGSLVELRQLARDLQIPIVLISSLNRASYNRAIELDSFKETGAIEYTADLLLGLQVAGIEQKQPSSNGRGPADGGCTPMTPQQLADQAKRKHFRDLELKVLKNRNGAMPPGPVRLGFFPAASLFIDRDAQPDLYRHVEDTVNHFINQSTSGSAA